MCFFRGWVLMLVLGALAHITHHPALALGYWVCVLVCFAVGLLFG